MAFNNTSVAFKEEGENNFLTKPFTKRTLSVWVKPSSLNESGNLQIIYDEGGLENGLGLALEKGKFIGGILSNPNGNSGKKIKTVEWSFESGGINKWYHVVLSYNGEDSKGGLF